MRKAPIPRLRSLRETPCFPDNEERWKVGKLAFRLSWNAKKNGRLVNRPPSDRPMDYGVIFLALARSFCSFFLYICRRLSLICSETAVFDAPLI